MIASRLVLVVFLFLALGILLPLPVRAGDDPPAFGASDLAIEEEGVEEPWEIVYEEVPGTPGEALEPWVYGVAKTTGLSEDDLYCEVRILKGPEGAAATLLIVEVDGDPKTLEADLKTRGQALGYVVQALGHPTRILVLAAPETARKSLMEMQLAYAVRSLTNLGWERFQKKSHVGAISFAKTARKLDPKAGAPMVILGMVATVKGDFDEAIEAFRVGFGRGATNPATGRLAMRGYAHYGKACLMKKDASLYKEARDAMEKAVALEDKGDPKKDPLFIQRYNLACAHARCEEVDEALTQLEKALHMAKNHPQINFNAFIENQVKTDEDLAGLKDHPGFKAILEKALGGAGGGTTGGL